MKYGQNIVAVSQLQPDYLGFIFHPDSPRYFQGSLPELPGRIKKTGVFVNASLQAILTYLNHYGLNAVQLHGQEPPQICATLKEEGIEVIKVFSIGQSFDFNSLTPYERVVDYFLFDTKGKAPGGNGITFNWDILRSYCSDVPFFLSGGIGPGEVEDIISLYKSWKDNNKEHLIMGVDLNSQFESAPGIKKTDELHTFLQRLQAGIEVTEQSNEKN